MLSICPMPYASNPPKTPAMVIPWNQIPWRKGCSDRLYHMETTILRPGAMAASVRPRKKRTAMMPLSLNEAAVNISTAPQTMLNTVSSYPAATMSWTITHIEVEIILPTGNRTSKTAAT